MAAFARSGDAGVRRLRRLVRFGGRENHESTEPLVVLQDWSVVALAIGEQMGRCGGPGEAPGGFCLGTASLLGTPNGGAAWLKELAGLRLTSKRGQYTLALKPPAPASTRRHAGLGSAPSG